MEAIAMGNIFCEYVPEEPDFSLEPDAPRNAPGPQPGAKINFPDSGQGTVLRRTYNGLLLQMMDGRQRWVPLSGLAR
eukprot:CAMPEP_0203991284 /NCGR_PEP_ID=MMETSP0360-20130528/9353_1 /ASSEMBLY_ACC=CAM_ASM_000342 /TAXON_ID=268821 /ORGANISM="Scrippsiella Hangoei, Strain SHTV-5" /LENGTH=76 /DNA_ID=CAMNT_0050931439 /DNA_START=239 /DNA_END=469 /DNA_ORIENTATION=-